MSGVPPKGLKPKSCSAASARPITVAPTSNPIGPPPDSEPIKTYVTNPAPRQTSAAAPALKPWLLSSDPDAPGRPGPPPGEPCAPPPPAELPGAATERWSLGL